MNVLKHLKPFIEFSLCCGDEVNVLMRHNGLAVWFCKPTTPLQFNDKLSKAYKLYRLLYAGRSKTQKL